MTTPSVVLVGSNGLADSVVRDALYLGVGPARLLRAETFEDAVASGGLSSQDGGLIVLVNPTPTEHDRIRKASDSREDPRWGLIVLAEQDNIEGANAVPREDWTVTALARTFRRELESHRIARAEARARNDLLSVGRRVIHDLRTPLGGIQIATEALRDELVSAPSSCKELLKSIESSTDEMARLMERVGFIVKATARPSALEPVDMGWAFASAEDRLGRRIQERRASVAQPPSWPTVMGVALWLEAIWSDLLGNAVDHGGDGVRVEAGWGQDEGMYRFWVQDTGPGVPAGQVPGLFHPFHRLHEPDAPTGLGLAMVERLVDLQKGRCAYEAAPGGGACFSFTLPVPL